MTEPTVSHPAIDKRFIVSRQGRQFVLYAGLLDLAHQMGLSEINTALLQAPSGENGYTAIVQAHVTLETGCYSGLGDANPDNVTRLIAPHCIRMAETRAKARALRDGTNVEMVAVEELAESSHVEVAGDIEEQPFPVEGKGATKTPTPIRQEAAPKPTQNTPQQSGASSGGLATPAQVRFIYSLGHDWNMTEGLVDAKSSEAYGVAPAELSRRQASDFIALLQRNKPDPQR